MNLLCQISAFILSRYSQNEIVGIAKEDIKKGDLVMFDKHLSFFGKATANCRFKKDIYVGLATGTNTVKITKIK